MKQLYPIAFIFTLLLLSPGIKAQNTLVLTIDEVIELAKEQSTQGIQAKHSFRSSYWQNRSYKAGFLPSLVFSGTVPGFSRRIGLAPQGDGTSLFKPMFSNSISGAIDIEQGVPLTGGRFTIGSNLTRTDDYGQEHFTQYGADLLNITYRQSIFGINQYKWDKKIEPKRYEEAKLRYLKAMEDVSLTGIRYFFDLASAQQNLATAEFNKANNDTLYKIAGGRYGIGTIGENEMLQSELNYMNASATLNDAVLRLATAKNRLRSFLGFNENVDISIIIPEETPNVVLDMEKIMELAKENSPELMAQERQLIEAQKNVASTKASRGFNADLYVKFGLNNFTGSRNDPGKIGDLFNSPKDAETVTLGVRVPILDWGQGKGRVKMAQSNEEMVKVQIEQAVIDFEQDVILQVNQYNMQAEQFDITSKADTIAQNRYKVSMQRFLIDKIDITEMNNAQNDRDRAKQSYVNSLRNYWEYYYSIRRLTLYDLIGERPLEADYDALIDK